MTKTSKATKEAEAIKKLDKSAVLAQERITQAAEKAQKMIDDACATATQALENSSRIPDKRNLNGSFQWDRGDRYRRGSDARIDRLEEQVDSLNKARGQLDVGAAQRVEQIFSLRDECKNLSTELHTKKAEIDRLADEFDASQKELSGRVTTLRELILEVRDGITKEIDALRLEFIKQQTEAQSNFQWKLIAALASMAFLFLVIVITILTHTFGGIPTI